MAQLRSTLVLGLSDRASGPLARLSASLARFQAQNRQLAAGLIPGGSVGRIVALAGSYAALSGSLNGTVGSAISFQSAMADVRKVVDTTPAGFQRLTDDVLALSRQLPVSAEGLAQIMAAAGQAGMAGGELTQFTDLAARVGVAFDMTAGQVGESIAKIKTQLNLTVSQTAELADVINHLSNTSASSAPDLIEFMRRVAAQGEVFGFTSRETLAIGSAMVAAGAQADVAATSFRNLGKALSRGESASKAQRKAFKTLGLDAKKIQKAFNEDADGTLFDVLQRLAELPEELQASTMSDLFGDEARALMPLLSNLDLLRDALRRANEEAARGSVGREFAARAATTEAALHRLSNNIRAIGIQLGSTWLPGIAKFAERMSTNLTNLGVTTDDVFDRMGRAWQGFRDGLGVGDDMFAGIKGAFSDLERFIFGTPMTGLSATEQELAKRAAGTQASLQRITDQFRRLGEAIRGVVSGDFSKLRDLASSLGALVDSVGSMGTFAGALGLVALSKGVRLLTAAAMALAFSAVGRMFLMASAVSAIVTAARDASSIGEFASNLKQLETLELVVLGAGLAVIAAKLFRVARGATKAAGAIKRFGAASKPAAKGAGAAAEATAKGTAAATEAAAKATPKGRAGAIVLGGTVAGGAIAALLGLGGDAGAAEAKGDGAEPRSTKDMTPLQFLRDLPRLLSERINADPAGFEKRLDLLAPAIAIGERLAAWFETLPQPPETPAGLRPFGADTPESSLRGDIAKLNARLDGYAGSLTNGLPKVSVPQVMSRQTAGTGQPVAADPAQVQAEIDALDGLHVALQRIGELRAEGTGRGGFREGYLDPAQRGEYQALTAQVEAATASLPNVGAAVDAFIQAASAGGEQARSALEAARAAIDTAKAGLVAFQAESANAASSAQTAGQTITTSLNVTVRPIVDTSSIDAASSKTGTLIGQLSRLNAQTANINAKVAGAGVKVEGRAKGGPVSAGQTYMVGEKGRELFLPKMLGAMGQHLFRPPTDGTVIPAHRTRELMKNKLAMPALMRGMRFPEPRLMGGLRHALQSFDERSGTGGLGALSGIFDALAERQEGAAMLGAFNAQPQAAAPAAAATPTPLGSLGGFNLTINELNVQGGTSTPAADIGRELGREAAATFRRYFSDGMT